MAVEEHPHLVRGDRGIARQQAAKRRANRRGDHILQWRGIGAVDSPRPLDIVPIPAVIIPARQRGLIPVIHFQTLSCFEVCRCTATSRRTIFGGHTLPIEIIPGEPVDIIQSIFRYEFLAVEENPVAWIKGPIALTLDSNGDL